MASAPQAGNFQPLPFVLNDKLTYSYRSLAPGYIRILTLLPAKEKSDRLYAEKGSHSLTTCPEYEALSYVWGEDVAANPIQIGDSYISTTSNLSSALRHLRNDSSPRTLWVDAVWIDQSNLAETSIQVRLMARIFRSASTVLAWLGEMPNARIDKKRLQVAGAMAFLGHGLSRPNTSVYIMHDLQAMKEEADIDESGRWELAWTMSGMDDNLNPCGVRSLYESVWFTRVWIVQEAALARKLVLHYGTGSLDWLHFERICMLIWLYCWTSNHIFLRKAWKSFARNCWQVVRAVHDARRYPYLRNWFKTIASLGSQACREEADRIFAFLVLLPSHCNVSFTVDYNEHPSKIYFDAATFGIANGVFESLYTAGAYRRRNWSDNPFENFQSSAYLPTWVPAYNANAEDKQILEPTWWMQNGYGNRALVDTKHGTSTARIVRQSNKPECISLEGSVVGKVVGTWSFSVYNWGNSEIDGSALFDVSQYRRTRSMCLQTLLHIETHLPDLQRSWKLDVLRTLVSCVDSELMWNIFSASQGISVRLFPLSSALESYIKLVLDGEDTLNLLQSGELKADSEIDAMRNLANDLEDIESRLLKSTDVEARTSD